MKHVPPQHSVQSSLHPKAPTPALDPTLSAERALRLLLLRLLEKAERRAEAIRGGSFDDDLRILRTSVRKMRVLFGQLRSAIPTEQRRRFQRRLRWISSETSACRDVDAFLGTLRPTRGLAPFTIALRREQERLRQQVSSAVASVAFRVFLVEFRVFLEDPSSWKRSARDATTPVRDAVRRTSTRAFRRMARHIDALGDTPSLNRLHAVRIDGKKLRYLLEQFKDLLLQSDADRTFTALKSLHDELGRVQDLRLHRAITSRVSSQIVRPTETTRRAVHALRARLRQQREALRSALPVAFSTFRAHVTASGITALFDAAPVRSTTRRARRKRS